MVELQGLGRTHRSVWRNSDDSFSLMSGYCQVWRFVRVSPSDTYHLHFSRIVFPFVANHDVIDNIYLFGWVRDLLIKLAVGITNILLYPSWNAQPEFDQKSWTRIKSRFVYFIWIYNPQFSVFPVPFVICWWKEMMLGSPPNVICSAQMRGVSLSLNDYVREKCNDPNAGHSHHTPGSKHKPFGRKLSSAWSR